MPDLKKRFQMNEMENKRVEAELKKLKEQMMMDEANEKDQKEKKNFANFIDKSNAVKVSMDIGTYCFDQHF